MRIEAALMSCLMEEFFGKGAGKPRLAFVRNGLSDKFCKSYVFDRFFWSIPRFNRYASNVLYIQ